MSFFTNVSHFQDRLAPSTITSEFDNVRFNAMFALDDDKANDLVNNAGADGFKLDSEPLFKVFLRVLFLSPAPVASSLFYNE